MAKKKKKKLTKAQLKRLRQRIARQNFGKPKKRKRKSSSIKSTPIRRMARRRKKKTRRVSSAMKPLAIFTSAGIYGALREKISNALNPVTSKIPLGSIGDEVGLLAVAHFLGKKVRPLRKVSQAAMFIESARIGEAIADGSAFGASSGGVGSAGVPTIG